jgi:hypothetical protein
MATTVPQPQRGLTFDDVWAALMETRARQEEDSRKMKEAMEEAARRMEEDSRKLKESQAKTEELIRKNAEKYAEEQRKNEEERRKYEENFNRIMARIDKVTQNVGGLNNAMGELIETLIAARLWEKFEAYPYNLKQAYQRMPVYEGHTSRVLTDIDILLANGEYVMAVEVKEQLNRKDDVDHHLKRMELIRQYPPAQCIGKKLLGAMAGGTVDPDVQAYAHSAGFFVLELTGESVRLTEAPQEFTPRQW